MSTRAPPDMSAKRAAIRRDLETTFAVNGLDHVPEPIEAPAVTLLWPLIAIVLIAGLVLVIYGYFQYG